jgi:Predicted membrane protein (DUF2207) C-terminal domain
VPLPADAVGAALLDELNLTGRQAGLLAAAAALSIVWLLALGLIRFARRPRDPPTEPPTLELGPEPPALANFLASEFRVTADAVPATLLDLAARRVVEIERVDVETYQCRMRGSTGESMLEYERRVLDLLRQRASNGVVPARALTTGPSEESKRWWKQFRGEVVADSQRRGLSRDIWDRRTIQTFAVAAVPATLLVGLAFGFEGGVGYAAVVGLILGGIASRRQQRDTPDGLAAAGRWVAVREQLEQDEEFQSNPPIAVALWERLLAYGAALGVAAGAVRPIPMGAESDRRAWSAYGGRWHQVDIRYPHLFPPLWGVHPGAALLGAVVGGAIAIFFLRVLGSLSSSIDDLGAQATLVVIGIYALLSLALLGAAAVAYMAVRDLLSTKEVTGEIVRLRTFGSDKSPRHYVAVDDGALRRVRAWQVKSNLYAQLAQYDEVTVVATRYLGYVRSITRPAGSGPSSSIA